MIDVFTMVEWDDDCRRQTNARERKSHVRRVA